MTLDIASCDTWTDQSGTRTIRAEFLEADEEKVRLD